MEKIKFNLTRAPKPLPPNQYIFCEYFPNDSTASLINNLPMRVGVASVENVNVILDNGKRIPLSGPTFADSNLKSGMTYIIEVFGEALVYDGSNDEGEAFQLSKEEYDQRTDSVKHYLMKNKLGKYSEEYIAKQKAERERQEQVYTILKNSIGSRCELDNGHRGILRYIGEPEFAPGFWVGVELDEPYGKNDGSVKGQSYFKCTEKYGVFKKIDSVKVGDYPPLDDELDEI